MLFLARQKIGPIAPVLREVDPGVDTSQMGSCGILYVICGALAGQSLDWQGTLFQIMPTGHEVVQQWLSGLSGRPSEIDLAFRFKDLVFKWAQYPAGLAVARSRLADFERDGRIALSDKGRQQFLDYFRLAITFNSLSKLETDEITAIRRWADDNDQGWATLFFAEGILLSSERKFPWPSIGAGLLMASHSAKDKVKMLLDQYRGR